MVKRIVLIVAKSGLPTYDSRRFYGARALVFETLIACATQLGLAAIPTRISCKQVPVHYYNYRRQMLPATLPFVLHPTYLLLSCLLTIRSGAF